MKYVAAMMVVLSVLGATMACSSDSSSSSANCAEAEKLINDCNANQSTDGGGSIKITPKAGWCDNDQGKKAADCMVAKKGNCSQITACLLTQ